MSTYGLDAKNILKLDKGTPNTLTIFPGGTGDEDIVALDDKDILKLNAPADVLTIFPGGAGDEDIVALDDKNILQLNGARDVLTLFPDGGGADAVAIKPDLQAGATAGHMMYRELALGIVKKVEVSTPLALSATGTLSYVTDTHVGQNLTAGRVVVSAPTLLSTNMLLSTGNPGNVGQNFITRASGASFLPGGDWQDASNTNSIPQVNRFQFLLVQADMTEIDPSLENHPVYVPCYYNV